MAWLTAVEYLCHKWTWICCACRKHFPDPFLIHVTRLTRRVPLVEQELLTLPEHLSSSPVFNVGSCYSIFRFMCMFCRSLFVFLPFYLLAIVLSVLFLFTASDYPFGIFKLFFLVATRNYLFTVWICSDVFNHATFYWSARSKPEKRAVMYLCVRSIDLAFFYLFFYYSLELFRQCDNTCICTSF
jgi:hypothetical protein